MGINFLYCCSCQSLSSYLPPKSWYKQCLKVGGSSAVFPTGSKCSITPSGWCLHRCLQLCAQIHKHTNYTPPYTLIIILGQHCSTAAMHSLLLLLNIATPLWWCSGYCWESSKSFPPTPPTPPQPMLLSGAISCNKLRVNWWCMEESGQSPPPSNSQRTSPLITTSWDKVGERDRVRKKHNMQDKW